VASAPLRSASASEIERSRADRFGSPVSSSWAACQASACSVRIRAVMSVCVTTTREPPATRAAWSRNQAVSPPSRHE
jgi:hypothetical protein